MIVDSFIFYNEIALLNYRLEIKRLSSLKLMGTPEALIVTVLETVVKGQKSGVLLLYLWLEKSLVS